MIDQLSLSEKLLLSGNWSKIRKKFIIWSVGALPGIAAIGLVILVRLTGSLQLIVTIQHIIGLIARKYPSDLLKQSNYIAGSR